MTDLNASHGQATGDAVLVEIAHRLTTSLPRGCEAGRVDGDRFAVIASVPPSADGAATADRLREHVLGALAPLPAAIPQTAWPALRSAVTWSVPSLADADALVREVESQLAGALPAPALLAPTGTTGLPVRPRA